MSRVAPLSETVLHNVRIIAIDQEIVQGGPAINATAGKVAQTVSLQLAPEQVKKITVAKQLGKLSLAVRSAVDHGIQRTRALCPAAMCRRKLPARMQLPADAAVVVYAGGKAQGILSQETRFRRHELRCVAGNCPPECNGGG